MSVTVTSAEREVVHARRISLKLTQRDVAKLSHLSLRTIRRIEKGERDHFDEETIILYLRELNRAANEQQKS